MSSFTWTAIGLEPFLRGEVEEAKPAYLPRSDGSNLFYPRHIHWISGAPEGMKSWLAQIAIADRLLASDRPNVALYIDFESDALPMVKRLLALGVPTERIRLGFIYVRPEEPLDEGAAASFSDEVLSYAPEITVIDGINAGMGLSGKDSNSSRDFSEWWGRLGRPAQKHTSGPTIAIDHVGRDPEHRGMYPIGTQSKLAVTDVHIGVEVIKPFGRGLTGLARLVIKKDRSGWLRGGAVGGYTWAELQLASDVETGLVTHELHPATSSTSASWRPTVLMERISRHLELQSQPQSTRAILDAVSGQQRGKQTAIKVLADEAYLDVQPGPRGGLMYASRRPFREVDPDRDPTVSDRDPVTVESTVTLGPPSYRGVQSGHGHPVSGNGATVTPVNGKSVSSPPATLGNLSRNVGVLASEVCLDDGPHVPNAAWPGQPRKCIRCGQLMEVVPA